LGAVLGRAATDAALVIVVRRIEFPVGLERERTRKRERVVERREEEARHKSVMTSETKRGAHTHTRTYGDVFVEIHTW
jgi:hypothetical protein